MIETMWKLQWYPLTFFRPQHSILKVTAINFSSSKYMRPQSGKDSPVVSKELWVQRKSHYSRDLSCLAVDRVDSSLCHAFHHNAQIHWNENTSAEIKKCKNGPSETKKQKTLHEAVSSLTTNSILYIFYTVYYISIHDYNIFVWCCSMCELIPKGYMSQSRFFQMGVRQSHPWVWTWIICALEVCKQVLQDDSNHSWWKEFTDGAGPVKLPWNLFCPLQLL